MCWQQAVAFGFKRGGGLLSHLGARTKDNVPGKQTKNVVDRAVLEPHTMALGELENGCRETAAAGNTNESRSAELEALGFGRDHLLARANVERALRPPFC